MTKETKDRLDKWVNKEYRWIEREVKANIAYGKMADYADELIQEMFIQLYNMKEEKIE